MSSCTQLVLGKLHLESNLLQLQLHSKVHRHFLVSFDVTVMTV